MAEPGDILEIAEIYSSLVGTPGCTWGDDYPSAQTAKEDIACGSLYILKDVGRIIAVASMGAFDELGHYDWASQNPCELARIGVMPQMQSRGIGSLMLKKVMDAARARGFDGMRFLVSKTNPAALAMYEKNGFERCGEAHEYDIDFYRYQIKL